MKILRYYLSESETTRRNERLEKLEKIVIYKVKSDKTALGYRLYIENLKRQEDIYFSVHYIVDKEGNIVNIIPLNEVSIHDESNMAINYITISILVLEDENGNICDSSIKELLENLVKKHNLNINKDVIVKDTSLV